MNTGSGRLARFKGRFYSFDQAKSMAPEDERMLFAILEKNVELFPRSFTAYELLAWFCDSRGRKDLALRAYRKVLELDPGNRNAVKMIERLQK